MAAPAVRERPVSRILTGTAEALYEVVDGQHVELPPMGIYAGWIATRLGWEMYSFNNERRLGTVVLESLFIFNAQRNLRRRPEVASWRELLERARDEYERQSIDELVAS